MASAALPLIGSLADGVMGVIGAGQAKKNIEGAQMSSVAGLNTATKDAQNAVNTALSTGTNAVNTQQANSAGLVDNGTANANASLNSYLAQQKQNLSPYTQAGAAGASNLENYANSNPTFNFAPTQAQLEQTPGYQFQKNQGETAITNQAAANGVQNSGNAAEALTNYAEGLAGTYYQNAFNNAQNTFQTNQNATLANNSTLLQYGLGANQQLSTGIQTLGGQAANNTMQAGLTKSANGLTAQQFLANYNLAGQEQSGAFGTQGSTTMGNWTIGAGDAEAGANMGIANSVGGAASGVANSLAGYLNQPKYSAGPQSGGLDLYNQVQLQNPYA